MRSLRLQLTNGHMLWVAALAPLCVLLFIGTRYQWAGPTLVGVSVVLAVVTFRGRRLTGWMLAVAAWLVRRRKPPDVPSEPEVGATVKPGDHVAVRWKGEFLCAVIELLPRAFTPTVIVDGQAHTDDAVDTRLLEQLLLVHCPDMEAVIVSAGYRVAKTASPEVAALYAQMIGSDPAPAHRRTWIVLRANPLRIHRNAKRRNEGIPGLAQYLVASATRIADNLAGSGIDAVCGRSFDDLDNATEVSFQREKWSHIKGHDNVTTAYTAPGGPDVWWSAPADHTITRIRIVPGMAPQSTVLLTTAEKVKAPRGFARVVSAQRVALQGQTLVTDRHCHVPIGSAGVLVGQTAGGCPVYMPFDNVDVTMSLGDARAFVQFVARATAAGAIATLGEQFRGFAELIGAQLGEEAKVSWPTTTTYLGPRRGVDRVTLRHNMIGTPRHRQLPIRPLTPTEEDRYLQSLPGQGQRARDTDLVQAGSAGREN